MLDDIISSFNTKKKLSSTEIDYLYENGLALLESLERIPNKSLAFFILKDAIAGYSGEKIGEEHEYCEDTLMFAAYLLAIHKDPADSILLWKAKTIDFDTECGFHTELILGAGIKETVAFLKANNSMSAKNLLEYIKKCQDGGLEDTDIEDYFSKDIRPYYLQ